MECNLVDCNDVDGLVTALNTNYKPKECRLVICQDWRTFLRAGAQIRRNFFTCHGNFEEQNKVLEFSLIISNYSIIIVNEYYNYLINV
jgi:hypothetical protein